jgi:hypothetical protein
MRQVVSNIFFLFLLIFSFSGCTYQICGVNEDIYKRLSINDQKQTCSVYQTEQLDRQRKLEEERKYSQKMISEAYAIGDIVRVSIMDGEIQYNKNIYTERDHKDSF